MTARGIRRVARPGALAVALPVALLAIAVVLGSVLWSRGDLNGLICDGDCGPEHVIAPRALMSDTEPGPVGSARQPTGTVDPAKLSAAVKGTLDSAALGPRVGFVAIDPASGTQLATSGRGSFIPASTTKVLTSFAALSLLDPQTRFSTRVVKDDDRVVLVGGGDPYLATKRPKTRDRAVQGDLTTLARLTASALKKAGTTTVSVGYDASLFTGPSVSPEWEPTYVSGNIVTLVSALWTDQGEQGGVRARDPAAAAARTFARLLAERGVTVAGEPATASASAAAPVVAVVRSATVSRIVERLIGTSDNQASEVMLRQAAIAADEPASFHGGTKAVIDSLQSAGVDTAGLRLFDGSGLSRSNRISPATLAQTLRAAASKQPTSELLPDLPVSGFTGTLVDRFTALTAAQGLVRAKTGTLTGVHSLTGYAVDADGLPVIFAVMTDDADTAMPLAAEADLDKVAAAIAACSCGR
ncbi:D-alanyl-D-alanine carboxypeptidase/D-alanyl-D-alanine-endopeptidase [Aeromicrobium sp.]|uniref:D-alanyl-D-alanine carboxypeptidase/D-alanyl-D-alanine endopeptidase n=1 Tax=Aeromicrobium sp. TaxID=1871063 RepID=UPI0019BB91E6|nr:D-alanyl-D-alanine carboxypeptidase/D-alanyl-D-alanine-endopeptidase [Aeromicrobium sp.]MBC7631417.1 D-alanyl-D-alanine carboxypeptidase/D-alanyl-D-alanine-endopeptidase [Aeromicrobium sp.]